MEFRTIVDIPQPPFQIRPLEPLLFVGSCFADSIGRRFEQEKFPVVVNPYGTMYNPVSVLHTLQRFVDSADGADFRPQAVFLTFGTNHVYRLKQTGEIVDNCQKRPASLFTEELLSIEQCADSLRQSIALLHRCYPDAPVVCTVSPIRYRKYGYHESQLSKATLLLAVDQMTQEAEGQQPVWYFPAYEIVNDELRDYRFYQEDMLHPSAQTVEYIWQRLVESCFSPSARRWLDDWRPVKQALAHRPFHADSEEYRMFMEKTKQKMVELSKKYPNFTPRI